MTNFCKYDVIVVKFPFASSIRYKARPAVIISTEKFNKSHRNSLIIIAISSQIQNKLDFEEKIVDWQQANLLKPSIFKASIATIEQSYVISKLGFLSNKDINNLDSMIENICQYKKVNL